MPVEDHRRERGSRRDKKIKTKNSSPFFKQNNENQERSVGPGKLEIQKQDSQFPTAQNRLRSDRPTPKGLRSGEAKTNGGLRRRSPSKKPT
jgi:hypothetical protein